MRKIFLIFVSLSIIISVQKVSAQHSVLRTPGKYMMPMDNASANISGASNKEGDLWVVFSDRPSNPVYSDRACTNATGRKLDFMEALYVVEESPTSVKIVNYDDVDFRGGLKDGASSNAVWVPKDKMLLWRTSLKTRDVNLPEFKDGIFNKKAMVLNIITGNNRNIRVPEIYSNPRCNPSDSISSALVYQINYVFKETETAYLLSDVPDIVDVQRDAQYIKGWVLKSQTTAWNHRLAFEMNWDDNAVNERKNKGVRAKITTQKNGGTTIFQEPSNYYSKRDIGEVDRFPVLDVYNGMAQVGVIGDLHSADGKTISSREFAKMKHVIDSMSASLRHINIMFVVDATSSMIPYSKAIQDAITTTMRKDLSRGQNSYRFGIMLYRDAIEGNNLTHDTRDLTSNWNLMNNFFNRFMSPTFNRFNTDVHEAMYYGMKNAIMRFNPPAGESNFMILIGDAGNHARSKFVDTNGQELDDPSNVSQQELIDLMAKKNVNLIAYQVQHQVTVDDKPAYDDFRTQVEGLIAKSVITRLNGINGFTESSVVERKGNEFKTVQGAGITGYFKKAPDGGRIHPNILVNDISDAILMTNDVVNNQLENISEYLNGKITRENAKGLGTFIKQLENQNISSDKLDIVFQKNGQLYEIGYTNRFENGVKNPIYQDVLLMSHEDIFKIKRSLERLIPTDDLSLSANESRSFIIYSWGEILVDILGYFPSHNEAIDTLSLYTLSAILTGWGGKEKYKDILLQDVSNPIVFPDLMLYEYLIDWCITKGHIQSIFEGQNVLTGDFFDDHRWTIFYEYLYLLTNGMSEEDEAIRDRFSTHFKQFNKEYNNFNATFRIPMGTGSGVKHYWIDARIFPHQIELEGEVDIIEHLYGDHLN